MALFKSFATVGGATLASRVLGFIREVLIASLLGTGPVADAFYAAFSVPNLFRRFLAEGAFNAAFVPLFAKAVEDEGKARARAFAVHVFSALACVLVILVALWELTMPLFIDLVVPGFGAEPDKRQLTVTLARIMMPYLFCLSLVALLSGILNTYSRYFLAAFAPVVLNIMLIAALTLCAVLIADKAADIGVVLAWSVLGAGIAQLLLLLFGVRQIGFNLSVTLPKLTPQVRHLLLLAAPVALSQGIVQVNLFIGRIIASGKEGAIAVLNYADRLYQLPLGVVGIAIGVVLLPELSRALRSGDAERAVDTENRSFEFALFLTLPAAAALFLVPEEIVRALFEHGAFTAKDTHVIASVLSVFAIGLPAFILIKIVAPCYFAREDTKTPMVFAAMNAAVNIGGSLLLFPPYGEVGIAAATSIAAWLNALLLLGELMRRGQWTFDAGCRRRVPRAVLATCALGLCLLAGARLLEGASAPQAGFFWHVTALAVLVGSGGLVYGAAALLGGAISRNQLKKVFLRRS